MKTLPYLLMSLLLAAPAIAQSTSQLKRDLKQQEVIAEKDTAQLVELAKWAKEKGLINDYRRLLNKVIKLDPDNAEAYQLQGYVRYEGKWMRKSKVAVLKRKAVAAEMKAKGFVYVDGVWVTKDEVADAEKGIFHHEDELCSKADKVAFGEGKVRHPISGEMVGKDDLDKAEDGLFPVAGGRWVSETEADKYHASQQHPWVFRSAYATIVSALPLARVKEAAATVDESIESVLPLFGQTHPAPAGRPYVLYAADGDAYRELGNNLGAEGSSGYGCFLAEQAITVGGEQVQPVVAQHDKDWGIYYLRHAAAMAFAHGHCSTIEAEVPLWFLRGVGSLAERHYNAGIAKWFGKQHVEKGGVQNLKSWFDSFEISGNLEPKQNAFNVYQAGLILSFGMAGKDDDTTEAIQAVTASLEKNGRTFAKSVRKLEKVVTKKEKELRDFLQSITAK